MPFCEECGAEAGPDRRLCEDCGAPLTSGEGPGGLSEYWLAVGIDRDGAIEACDHALAVRPEFY